MGGRDAVDPEAAALPGAAAPRCSEVRVLGANESTREYSTGGESGRSLHGKKFVNSQEEPLGVRRPVLGARHGVLRRKGFHLPTAPIAQFGS